MCYDTIFVDHKGGYGAALNDLGHGFFASLQFLGPQFEFCVLPFTLCFGSFFLGSVPYRFNGADDFTLG